MHLHGIEIAFLQGMLMRTGGIHMKSYLAVLCLICAILLPSFGYASQYGDMYLRFLEGDVQVKTEDTAEWLPASINMPLINGDHVWVPDNGRAELMLRNGTVIRLDRNSYLEILAMEEGYNRFYLDIGHTYIYTKLNASDAIIFETPTASFYVYGRSIARIDVSDREDSAAVSVLLGTVYADGGTGKLKINPSDRIVFYKNDSYPRLTAIAPPDQWEQWNKQRDRDLGLALSAPTSAYLPDELSAYYYDFERNGRWTYEPEYGYVWMPTTIVERDWSPYRMGRWVWMHGDYVWISYESWGWVPHHYGRWAFIQSTGWCWIPPARGAVYWGPGFVGWVSTPIYISWVPLAPRETYYGYGNYGPHSINIKNTHFRIPPKYNDVYRNIHVRNAVTTLHRNSFMTGVSTVNRLVHDNPFLKERHVMAPPDMRPERSAFMPVIKDIPQAKKPPQQIVNRTSGPRRINENLGPVHVQGNNTSATPIGRDGMGPIDNNKTGTSRTSNGTSADIQQTPPARKQVFVPQEPIEEKIIRQPVEVKRNNPQENIVKDTTPRHPVQIPITNVPDKSTPSINVKQLPTTETNSRSVTVPVQAQTPGKENNTARFRNVPQQNSVKEGTAVRQGPPNINVNIQERKIETQKKITEIPAIRPQAKMEVQQQTPQHIANTQHTPPPSPRKLENTQTDQKIEQNTQANTFGGTPPEQKRNNFRKDFRTEMRPGRQNIMSPN